MLRRNFIKLLAAFFASIIGFIGLFRFREAVKVDKNVIKLPEPVKTGKMSVEEAIEGRRSRREYANTPVSLKEISQLCWAAQGITDRRYGFRAAPSAGALYPLEIFIVAGNTELEQGIYQYLPDEHGLKLIESGDFRGGLAKVALGQSSIKNAAMNIVITAIYERTARKYGSRAERYVHMEAGHAAQNVYLQAESLELATVSIGAFYDGDVRELLLAPEDHIPLYIMPVGKKK
jgi:SagB-type dehydrogenase family enzyme